MDIAAKLSDSDSTEETAESDSSDTAEEFDEFGLLMYGTPSQQCLHPKPWKKLRAKRGFKFFLCNHCAARWRLPCKAKLAAVANRRNSVGQELVVAVDEN